MTQVQESQAAKLRDFKMYFAVSLVLAGWFCQNHFCDQFLLVIFFCSAGARDK